jgi:hypothetical protein
MVKNLELCQTFFDITDPQWSSSMMELCGSAALLMVETRNNLQSASVQTYTFFTTG